MSKIANYRSGDRAESLGITLLQSFCAVAPVPRQEDFGIVDAVATILRRDGRMLSAEDSFQVQFKSRTVTEVEYLDERFDALLQQELGLFIASVDLRIAEMTLFSIGSALLHPNIHDMKGVIVYLGPHETTMTDGILRVSLGPPVLRLSSANLDDRVSQDLAFAVVKKWLEFDRWNRRYRRMGVQFQIQWQTNELPSQGTSTIMWSPKRAITALTEVVPAIQLIGSLAMDNWKLTNPLMEIISWMRSHGVDPDPTGMIGLSVWLNVSKEEMQQLLEQEKSANAIIRIHVVTNEPGRYVFWQYSCGRTAGSSAEKHECSNSDEFLELGFQVEIDESTRKLVEIGLSDRWLKKRHLELIDSRGDMFLLRKHPVSTGPN